VATRYPLPVARGLIPVARCPFTRYPVSREREYPAAEVAGELMEGVDPSLSHHMLYHMVVARREVLVQLDDDLVEALDRIASQRGVSRSELIRRGAEAVVIADDEAGADARLIAAYQAIPEDPLETDALLGIALEVWPEY
jgi:hypothetical protein